MPTITSLSAGITYVTQRLVGEVTDQTTKDDQVHVVLAEVRVVYKLGNTRHFHKGGHVPIANSPAFRRLIMMRVTEGVTRLARVIIWRALSKNPERIRDDVYISHTLAWRHVSPDVLPLLGSVVKTDAQHLAEADPDGAEIVHMHRFHHVVFRLEHEQSKKKKSV